MENLLAAIITRLEGYAQSLGLSYIDEEYGQVDFLDDETRDTYPVTFPCVLVDCPGEDWAEAGRDMQEGTATVNVNVYMDCYDDTHANSTTVDKVSERCGLVREVTELLQNWRPLDSGRSLVRTATRASTNNHGIKMYQVSFTVRVFESFAPAQAVKSNVSHLIETEVAV